MLCSALSCHKFTGPFKYIKKEQLELGALRLSLQTNAVLMSSWAKGFQSMSNALCCDPVLAPRLEQPPAGSREVDTTAHLPLCLSRAAAWSWLTAELECGQNRERWLEHSAWTNYYQLSPLGLKIPLGKNDVKENNVPEKLQNTFRGELLLLAAAPGTGSRTFSIHTHVLREELCGDAHLN